MNEQEIIRRAVKGMENPEIRKVIGAMLRENVDECFDSEGAYNPPPHIVRTTWRALAHATPDETTKYNFFFSDAINGNDAFEKAVISLAETGGIVDAQAVMSRALDLFEENARMYLADFEVELRAYWARPTDRE